MSNIWPIFALCIVGGVIALAFGYAMRDRLILAIGVAVIILSAIGLVV
jgi:hypothetical protein